MDKQGKNTVLGWITRLDDREESKVWQGRDDNVEELCLCFYQIWQGVWERRLNSEPDWIEYFNISNAAGNHTILGHFPGCEYDNWTFSSLGESNWTNLLLTTNVSWYFGSKTNRERTKKSLTILRPHFIYASVLRTLSGHIHNCTCWAPAVCGGALGLLTVRAQGNL